MNQVTEDQVINQEAIKNPNEAVVNFTTGFKRGENVIKQVTVRMPNTRALRGLSLVNLLQLDVASIATVAPRVTQPAITENDIYDLSPADMTKLSTAIIGFFVDTDAENSLST